MPLSEEEQEPSTTTSWGSRIFDSYYYISRQSVEHQALREAFAEHKKRVPSTIDVTDTALDYSDTAKEPPVTDLMPRLVGKAAAAIVEEQMQEKALKVISRTHLQEVVNAVYDFFSEQSRAGMIARAQKGVDSGIDADNALPRLFESVFDRTKFTTPPIKEEKSRPAAGSFSGSFER